MQYQANIYPFLRNKIECGLRVAIVTLVNVEGSSPRPIGSQIGVCEDGTFVGMITGGCAEKAIVAEAIQCLTRGADKIVRYGEGSPYLDVVLPCGSGIDLHFTATNANDILEAALEHRADRRPFWLFLDRRNSQMTLSSAEGDAKKLYFQHRYDPDYRILVFGEGANLISFANVAAASGYDVHAFSPDSDTLDHLPSIIASRRQIHKSFPFSDIVMDRYSAVITLFHEHDWEHAILHAALNSDADHIGALGSRRTHQARLEALQSLGETRRPLCAIRGPVGLDIGAENPLEISLSILAEITQHRRMQ